MTYATRIVPAMREVAQLLTAAGVPTSLDREAVTVPGAWITPVKISTTITLAGVALPVLRVSVLLVVPGQKDSEALGDLAGLLELALTVIDPDEDDDADVDTSVVVPIGQNMLPGFRLALDIPLED